jgi:hypothetical protein
VRAAHGVPLAAGLLAAALAGCGGVRLQDDFAVVRTGGGAPLEVVVNDSGAASCNRRATVPITDPQLIAARALDDSLAADAQRGANLAPGPQPVYRYSVRTPSGHLRFSDDSPGASADYGRLELLVLQIAQQDCHLAQ